jgi:hypothetical protein
MTSSRTLTQAPRLSIEADARALPFINDGRTALGLPELELNDLGSLEVYTSEDSSGRIIGAAALQKRTSAGPRGTAYDLVGIGIATGHRGEGRGTELLKRTLRDTAMHHEAGPDFGKTGIGSQKVSGRLGSFLLNSGIVLPENNLPKTMFDPEI